MWGKHKKVAEYDGAYKCLDCQRSWGALPGHPVMPTFCEMSGTMKRIMEIEAEVRKLDQEMAWLRSLPDACVAYGSENGK